MIPSLEVLVLGNGGMVSHLLPHNALLLGGDFMVDCPHDIVRSFQTLKLSSAAIRMLYVSHFHADHTFGFPMFLLDRWMQRRSESTQDDLQVYGPRGVARYVTTLTRMGLYADHPAYQWMLAHVHFTEVGPRKPFAYKKLQAKIVLLDHVKPTQGFTLTDATGRAVFSYLTDTRWCRSVEKALRERPLYAWIDLNGGTSGMHLSYEELAQKGLPLTGTATRYLGTHVARQMESLHEQVTMVKQGDRFTIPLGSVPVHLVRFEAISDAAYQDYVAEWLPNGEHFYPLASDPKGRSFVEMQTVWAENETDAPRARGYVPSTLYFLVEGKGRILGSASFRHELTERLLLNGGHIGYGIRPSERGHGYGRRQLELVLQVARQRGLEKVLITCDDTNLASARTIESAGGVLHDKPEFEGVLTRRYWVALFPAARP